MDSLHRSKHLWCLKRCKEASIDRSQDKQKGAKGLVSNFAEIEGKIKRVLLCNCTQIEVTWLFAATLQTPK
jgi:hypothetical protein